MRSIFGSSSVGFSLLLVTSFTLVSLGCGRGTLSKVTARGHMGPLYQTPQADQTQDASEPREIDEEALKLLLMEAPDLSSEDSLAPIETPQTDQGSEAAGSAPDISVEILVPQIEAEPQSPEDTEVNEPPQNPQSRPSPTPSATPLPEKPPAPAQSQVPANPAAKPTPPEKSQRPPSRRPVEPSSLGEATPERPCDDGTKSDSRRNVCFLINQTRAQHGLGLIRLDRSLTLVAQAYAKLMHERGFFAHVTPEGVTMGNRLRSGRVKFSFAGENIARGQRSSQEVVGDWMRSPGHRANILRPRFQRMGLGRVGNVWVQLFAD